ncbi:hypothetical protein pipiens_010834 [Culex pipiens pipiens]|uniref:Uncharacterized protein n=1 Tax=Culex pipiens pipiens TaxID=38569 RepID=A0ABD1D8L6_CULPP
MEENVISMFMDVKLDIRERKLEFSHLKSWTRYFVRVEAVKCFPCYMKISFFKSATEETTDLIVRINIPGLTVQMATSRTRAHSYGLFWKHNRKRCCAYFALASQLLCERHLRWMKKSIRNLELYRQEILQLRRASRTPMHEIRQEMHPGDNDELLVYQNLELTQDMTTTTDALPDRLGPLPNVPPAATEQEVFLRRISGVSGIYEEIFDPARASGVFRPRASVVSGIYEEMKLTDIREQHERSADELTVDGEDEAPPLPPRPRSHTNEFELQRSFTSPESDYLKKKKHWQLFETMFGRRRTNSGSSGTGVKTTKVPATEVKKPDQKVVYRDKVARLRFSENKRNSFSSPDLSALKVDEGGSAATSGDNLSDEGSCSSEFYVQRDVEDYIEEDCYLSTELLPGSRCPSIEESLANLLINGEDGGDDSRFGGGPLNVSEKVVPNLNGSCNSSTVNLVGFSCSMSEPVPVETTEGYCEMGAPGTGFNRLKLQEVELRKPLEIVESIYMDMDGKPGASEEASRSSSTSSGVSSMYSNTSSVCSSGKQRNSIDDKIPSYYPNEDFRTPKKVESHVPRKIPKPKESPSNSIKRSSSQRKHHVPPGISTMPRACKSAQKPSSSRSKLSARSASSERCAAPTPQQLDTSPTKNIENSPPEKMLLFHHQKYATIARSNSSSSSSSKYAEKNSSSKKAAPEATSIIGTSRRFGSLPRFAKFDLSPLRLKINSVLQRHNSENL